MAKVPRTPQQSIDANEEDSAEIRAITDTDVLPNETIEQWVARKNREEGIGPDGRYTYESNTPRKISEDYDPNMGCL